VKVDIKIDGLQHLEHLLTTALPAKASKKVMVRALKKAGRPMVNAARSGYRAIGSSGSLAEATSIWQRKKGAQRGDTFGSVELGPRRSNKAALARYYQHYRKLATPRSLMRGIRHGHLVEFGFTNRAGRSVAGRRVLDKVMAEHAQRAISEFRSILGGEIEREAVRQAQKQRPNS
jgi:hypothetical protein